MSSRRGLCHRVRVRVRARVSSRCGLLANGHVFKGTSVQWVQKFMPPTRRPYMHMHMHIPMLMRIHMHMNMNMPMPMRM